MRKNAINWRRTIFGSVLEILLPVALMFMLVYLRSTITPQTHDDVNISQLKKPFYPIASLTATQLNTSVANLEITSQGLQIKDFMGYTEYISAAQTEGQVLYDPLLDPQGPYYFSPEHC